MAKVTVYHYPACSTCKKALKWLEAHGVEHERVHIVEAPPTVAKLGQVLRLSGLPVGKLFNTSGVSYREGGFKSRLATMSEGEALAALARDGKLVKRPVVIGDGFALVGFREGDYAARFVRCIERGRGATSAELAAPSAANSAASAFSS